MKANYAILCILNKANAANDALNKASSALERVNQQVQVAADAKDTADAELEQAEKNVADALAEKMRRISQLLKRRRLQMQLPRLLRTPRRR